MGGILGGGFVGGCGCFELGFARPFVLYSVHAADICSLVVEPTIFLYAEPNAGHERPEGNWAMTVLLVAILLWNGSLQVVFWIPIEGSPKELFMIYMLFVMGAEHLEQRWTSSSSSSNNSPSNTFW